jgi:hypothetical protein
MSTRDFLSENALALTLVGISAGWLALTMGRQRASRELVSEYPVAAGALAIATGVGIAMALPETDVENRLVSPVARGLKDQARGLVEHVKADLQTARETAGELRDALVRPAEADA